MNIYSGLLFLHGHISDATLARQLAGVPEVDAGEALPSSPDASPSGEPAPVARAGHGRANERGTCPANPRACTQ